MGLSVEAIARGAYRLFRRFRPFLAFQILQSNVQFCIDAREDCKVYMGRNCIAVMSNL
jgi:hypothetical protein